LKKGAKVQLTRLILAYYNVIGLFQKSIRNITLKPILMKIKAILFAAAIFGATFFVTSSTENDNNDTIQKTAVDKRLIRVPAAG